MAAPLPVLAARARSIPSADPHFVSLWIRWHEYRLNLIRPGT